MSTYTSSLGLELITPGSQAGLWGNTTNNSLNLIDQAITGVTPISFASASGSTHTLTDYNGAEDEARAAVLNVTGSATGANTIVIPNKQKTYLVRNSTGFDVNIKTLSGSAYVLGDGYNNLVFCDGNNGVFPGILAPGAGTVAVNGGGTGQTSFTAGFIKSPGGATALTSSATVNATSEISGTLPVANGGTGKTSLTAGALLFGNGTGAVGEFVGGSSGQVATWNGSGWVAAAPGTSAVSSVFGRTGAVTAQSTDYSSYYGSLGGANTWTSTNTFNGAATFNSTCTAAGINYSGAGSSIGGNGSNLLVMYTNGSAALSLGATDCVFSSRNVAITSASLLVNTNTNTFGSVSLFNAGAGATPIVTYVNTTATNNAISFQNTSGTAGQISTNGSTTNYGTSSDYRLKENVESVKNALATVEMLNPVTFNWKFDGSEAIGFIAHELQAVVPTAVVGEKDAVDDKGEPKYQNIDQSKLVSLLTAAIKELKAEVDALKADK